MRKLSPVWGDLSVEGTTIKPGCTGVPRTLKIPSAGSVLEPGLYFLSLSLLLSNSCLCSHSTYPITQTQCHVLHQFTQQECHLLIKVCKILQPLWFVISFNHEHLQILGTPLPLKPQFLTLLGTWMILQLPSWGVNTWKVLWVQNSLPTQSYFTSIFQPRYRDFNYSTAENFLSLIYCINCIAGFVQYILDRLTHLRLQVSQYKYLRNKKLLN